jgi:hypothetical protein
VVDLHDLTLPMLPFCVQREMFSVASGYILCQRQVAELERKRS